jgi:hypothetical protein
MSSMRRAIPLLLLVLTVLLGAGCGGEEGPPSIDEFEETIVLARDRVDFAIARIPRAKSLEEYANRLEEASVVADDAADDIEELGPAENFEEETTRLVDAFRQLSVDYGSTAEQIRQTPDLLTGALGLSFDSWDKANLALAGMAGKGLDRVVVLQRHGRS